MNSMIAVPLETERLRLERLSTKFCTSTYVSWMNDPEVIKYLDSGGDYTLEKLEDFLKGVESKDMLFWAIVDKGLDKHIGNIKIDPFSIMHHRGEYGILIGDKTAWGKGYAKEASIEVINYCFKNLNMKKVTLGASTKAGLVFLLVSEST